MTANLTARVVVRALIIILANVGAGASRIGPFSRRLGGFAIAVLVGLSGTRCFAKANGPEHATFESYYSTYSFVTGNSSAATKQLTPSIDAEIALRMQAIFSFLFIASGFTDPDPDNGGLVQSTQKGFGLGMRIELPGFFFLFGKKQDSSRDGKFYPVNTYMFGEAIRFESTDIATGAKTTFTAPKYGFGTDFFLFNPYAYLSLRYGLFSYLGSTYGMFSAGVGVSL